VQPRFPPDQKQDMTDSETIKGAEVEREKAQKASEVMAERLPGLIVPNVPADQQPLNDSSNPNPVAHPPQAIRPDRFTPGTDPNNGGASAPANTEPSAAPQRETAKPAAPAPAQKKPPAKPSDQNPGRNP
jgi:hypothetical protein